MISWPGGRCSIWSLITSSVYDSSCWRGDRLLVSHCLKRCHARHQPIESTQLFVRLPIVDDGMPRSNLSPCRGSGLFPVNSVATELLNRIIGAIGFKPVCSCTLACLRWDSWNKVCIMTPTMLAITSYYQKEKQEVRRETTTNNQRATNTPSNTKTIMKPRPTMDDGPHLYRVGACESCLIW